MDRNRFSRFRLWWHRRTAGDTQPREAPRAPPPAVQPVRTAEPVQPVRTAEPVPAEQSEIVAQQPPPPPRLASTTRVPSNALNPVPQDSPVGDSDGDSDSDIDSDNFAPPGAFRPPGTAHAAGAHHDLLSSASLIIGGSLIHGEGHTTVQEPSQKVFSFLLPFGTPSISLPSSLPLPKFLKNGTDEPFDREELRLKLQRQETITTIEEEYLLKDIKLLGNGRLAAIRQTFTPQIVEDLMLRKQPPQPSAPGSLTSETAFDHIDGPVVILGGYRGLVLRDSVTHRRVWLPVKVGFNLRQVNLVLGPDDMDEVRATDTIYPVRMMGHVGPVDVCKRLIRRLKEGCAAAGGGGKVYEFGYDWRLLLDLLAERFKEFLEVVQARHQGSKVLVIAHLMGGLVAHTVMQQLPEMFRGLLYVGVPIECKNILGPIRFDDAVAFNKRVLTAEATFMMRSSFVFLPTDQQLFVNRATGESYKLDFFDPEVWVEYNLNALVSKERREKEQREKELREPLLEPLREPLEKERSELETPAEPDRLPRHATAPLSPRRVFGETLVSSKTTPSFGSDSHSITFSQAYDYLKRTLARTAAFREALTYNPELADRYPPLAMVYGNQVPLLRHSWIDSPQDIKDGKYYDFAYGVGDGVINARWLMPERAGFSVVSKVASAKGHVSLLTDLPAVGEAIRAILVEERLRANSSPS